MLNKFKDHRLYWLLHLSGWLGMIGVEVINYTFFIVGKFDWAFVQLFGFGAFLGGIFTHVFRFEVKKHRVFEWSPQRLWILAFLSTFLMSVLINLLFYLPSLIRNKVLAKELFSFIGLFGGTINWMRYVGVWVILYFMYHILERTRKIQELKLESENVARVTELELLKTQLNPHFLFNALNSIKALVSIDPEKSKDAIIKLSELLRFTLNYGSLLLIPLHDEIDEVKKYLSLEQIRFGDRLQVYLNIEDSALNRLVPPAIILTLAENTIKHGVAKQSGNCIVEIKVSFQQNKLSIEMKNPGKLVIKESPGIGLQNVKKRLKHLFGDLASFTIIGLNESVIANIEILYDENWNYSG